MKKAIGVFLGIVLSAAMSFSQSSGNFSYGNTGTTHCVLNNDGTGTITGGDTCEQQTGKSCTSDTECGSGLFCFNPTGAAEAGQCLNSTSGASCTSDGGCTVPGQTCIKPVGGGATGICGVVQDGACAGALRAATHVGRAFPPVSV